MKPWLLLLVASLTLLKLALAAQWGWTTDIRLTLEEVHAFRAGLHSFHLFWPSASHARFPLGYYALSCGAASLADWTHLPFSFWIKVPAILADAMIAWWLSCIPRNGTSLALCYLLNPVSFLLSVYHGQLHTVAAAFMVWTLISMDQHKFVRSGIALGLATSVRHHFAVLLVPLVVAARKSARALLLSFTLVVLLTNLSLVRGYGSRLVAPVWAYGTWGYSMLLVQGPRVLTLWGFSALRGITDSLNAFLLAYGPAISWLWMGAFFAWVWWKTHTTGRLDPWRATLVYLLGQYAISPGFGVQWLIWVLPIWLVVNQREAIIYSGLAGLFLAGSYWQWSLNTKYSVASITANLSILHRADFCGVLLVGFAGLLTWMYCARAAWRFARS